jgi:hypothetical protein
VSGKSLCRNTLGSCTIPPPTGICFSFTLYEGIIMHKIVLVWQFESMIRDGAVYWHVVGISWETAVCGDEPSHCGRSKEPTKWLIPCDLDIMWHCCDQLILYYQLLWVLEGGVHDSENIRKAADAGKYISSQGLHIWRVALLNAVMLTMMVIVSFQCWGHQWRKSSKSWMMSSNSLVESNMLEGPYVTSSAALGLNLYHTTQSPHP